MLVFDFFHMSDSDLFTTCIQHHFKDIQISPGNCKIFKEIFLFRRLLKSEKYPICSWVYAYSVYNAVGYQFNNIRPNWVDPDVMHDEMIRSKDWEIIFRYTKKKKHINTSV